MCVAAAPLQSIEVVELSFDAYQKQLQCVGDAPTQTIMNYEPEMVFRTFKKMDRELAISLPRTDEAGLEHRYILMWRLATGLSLFLRRKALDPSHRQWAKQTLGTVLDNLESFTRDELPTAHQAAVQKARKKFTSVAVAAAAAIAGAVAASIPLVSVEGPSALIGAVDDSNEAPMELSMGGPALPPDVIKGSPEPILDDYGLVIVACKELEGILEKRFGARGRGLHEKATTATLQKGDSLPASLTKRLRYIASVRNQLVHQSDCPVVTDRAGYSAAVAACKSELGELLGSSENIQQAHSVMK
eukprot:NODE_2626_length_1154_cov_31.258824_g2404_i0.p1 GENE.NODE_2626_length_1154_cov_31.258824_g2404_i0~~NODE_2626_length_1154_cov_31.258824_g2404_i0.p1  ORF type:complete len:302 (-),score=55.12 NODE_2626_length_1154_cov_31.258824_g2404_i0:168-1073(-)